MTRTLFVLAVAALCIETGSALKCYSCSSHNNSRCAHETPPSETIRECRVTDEQAVCRKVVQTIEFPVNGLSPDVRIVRGCASDGGHGKDRCYEKAGFGGKQEICSCEQDLCNGSTNNINVPIFTVTLVVITSLFMRVIL